MAQRGKTTAPAAARLTELPSWLVGQAARHADRLVSEALAEDGMRKHHFATLLALAELGPSSQAALGRRLWIDRSDLHAVLNDLERRGFLARARDKQDRRRNVVELTGAGTRALKRLDARVEEAQDAFLAPLSAAQRRELRTLLTQVQEHHGKLADSGE